MVVKRFSLHWEVGPAPAADLTPVEFVPAQVPGAVQLDWARAHGIPFPEFAGNSAGYRWMEDSFWLYRARLSLLTLGQDEQAFFVCGGVDYRFQVRLSGRIVFDYEGMFAPIEIPLCLEFAPESILEILVFPAPKSHHNGDNSLQANRSTKPAVSYGWDFHPRLIPLGIWENAAVEVRPAAHLCAVETSYLLDNALENAELAVDIQLNLPAVSTIRWQILDPGGAVVLEQTAKPDSTRLRLSSRLENPRLWWPNGQGDQPLYTSRTELVGRAGEILDGREQRLGFRRIRLVRNVPDWDPTQDDFPRGPLIVPIVFEVNGRQIFAKGSNWVSPDIFPGRIDGETYRPLLQMAREANLNILRCWGGAIVQKEAFFDQCDELGLMVWQEFPLSCNYYEGEDYLKVLDQESRAIILRLRGHPSLALWCGGNELFNVWSGGGMSEQDLAIRLLNRNTLEMDPTRPFLNTAPLYGMGHGFYVFCLPDGTELYQYLPQRRFAAYSEFGVSGPSPVNILEKIIPAEERFPPRRSPAWIARHAFGAWDGSPGSWLEYDFLVRFFGAFSNLEEVVEAGQFIQAEGLRFFFEESRRQKPYCSLALNWCLNEPWPTAANSSIIAWPAQPKPALDKVRLGCRPVLASARPARLRWKPGQIFTADLFILNDSPQALSAGAVEAILVLDGREVRLMTWDYPAAAENINITGPQLRFELPQLKSQRFELVLHSPGKPELDSTYSFLMA